jgi:HPt (histidine-containing phosphotransfer) domain-containing protein
LARERGWLGAAIYDDRAWVAFSIGEVDNAHQADAVRALLTQPRIGFVDLHRDGQGVLHYGTIGAASRAGEGSDFWFELPFERTDATPSVPDPVGVNGTPPGSRLAGLRVLVVDDSDLNRDVVERMLALEGATATLVGDGQVALETLRTHPQGFDAVLILFGRLLGRFAESAGAAVTEIHRALAAGERERAARQMHVLKGNAGTIGALEIMAQAAHLETVIKEGETGLDGLLAALGDRIGALVADSAPWCDTSGALPIPTPETGAVLDPERLCALHAALSDGDLAAVSDYEVLRPALRGVLAEDSALRLDPLIRGLRFEEALALLESLPERWSRKP